MFKWVVLSAAILIAALFLNDEHNRNGLWKLTKRFWKPFLAAVVLIAALSVYAIANE